MIKWTVREVVRREYTYDVEATTCEEAIQKVERGEAVKCRGTQELKPQYIGYPIGCPHSLPL